MFFLFGERVHGAVLDAGERQCGVCNRRTHFSRVIETNYFCVFGLRLLPIEKVADYVACDDCGNSFAGGTDQPSQLPVLKRVLAYLLLGYGMQAHRNVAGEICEKVSGFDYGEEELAAAIRELDAGGEDIFDLLKRRSMSINAKGAQQIIQAAFLMTHVCCEIQFEDRVRINLMGNALGVSLAFVEAAIQAVRDQRYYGVRRLLAARAGDSPVNH